MAEISVPSPSWRRTQWCTRRVPSQWSGVDVTTKVAVVELIVIDSGPGIDDVSNAMRDGVSTAGTLGIGLGAIDRIANRFEMFSLLGRGSGHGLLRFGPSTADAFLMPILDGLTRPISGESVCGDAWAAHRDDRADQPDRCRWSRARCAGGGGVSRRARRVPVGPFTESVGDTARRRTTRLPRPAEQP